MSPRRTRILLVDDEPAILASLANLFRRDRHRWDVVLANGGPQAVRELDQRPFDIVITDMRMPEIDGAALLELVKARSPGTVRIMLSGHAESEAVLRALPLVHQFLSKPCDIRTLRATIERCSGELGLGDDRSIVGVIGRLPRLPSAPSTCAELARMAADPHVTIGALAAIVARDPALGAKVLQIVNTPYFSPGQVIASIPLAVSTLGLEVMQRLAESSMVGNAGGELGNAWVERVQADSVRCAQLARQLVTDPALGDEAYAAGLLHDLGRLVLAVETTERYTAVVERVARTGEPLCEVEHELLGVTHPEVGAHLLSLWALPPTLVEAVARHHAPRAIAGSSPVVIAVQGACERLEARGVTAPGSSSASRAAS